MCDGQCDHFKCDEDAAVVRRDLKDDVERKYCHQHDPLEDPRASQFWEEVAA